MTMNLFDIISGRKRVIEVFFLLCLGYVFTKIVVFVIYSPGSSLKLVTKQSSAVDLAKIINGEEFQGEFVTFNPDSPKKVVVMTYQRCGSSFIGQLFNKAPGVFYMFEPLDSLYSALYGVQEGWNVPSDITTYWNGTERKIPPYEQTAVATYLSHLLSCDVDGLPTETLIHKFWFMFETFHESLQSYTKCLKSNNIRYTRCASYTPAHCGKKFGEFSEERIKECNRLLWNKDLRNSSTSDMSKDLNLYSDCMDQMRSEVDKLCLELFKQVCRSTSLRTAKTVRATMHSMGPLLKSDSNVRIIHLIRDPRAVVLSRKHFDSSARSHYSGGNLVREAEVYCRDVVRDVRHRRELESQYPGRIMTVIYDDLTKDPLLNAEEIYRFINTTMHSRTVEWLIKNTKGNKNSTKIAAKWQQELSYDTAKSIYDKCKDFFKEVNYKFS